MQKLFSRLARKKGCLFAFFLPAFLLFFAYSLCGTYPFGKNSVLILDLSAQYVWYFEAFRDAILSGEGFFYSLARSLGGEMLGIYAYYLASPLSFLVLLFPKEKIDLAIYCMLLIKTALSGGTMFLLLSKRCQKLSYPIRLSLCCAYALCAFAVCYQSNLMWMDAVALLPLVLLGLERFLTKDKPCAFVASLAILFLCNYYVGYMVILFCGCVTAAFLIKKAAAKPPISKRYFLRKTTHFILFNLSALFFSAVIWLPGLYSLTLGKLASSGYTPQKFFNFSLLDALAKLLPSSFDSLMENGLPFLYCGIPVLFALPLYFFSAAFTKQEKYLRGGGLLLLFLCMWIRPLDLIWHGFRAPNCLNFRYAFLLCFLMILTAADGLCAPPKKTRQLRPFLITLAICLSLFSLLLFLFFKNIILPIPFLILSLCGIAFGFLCFHMAFSAKKRRLTPRIFSLLFCVLLCAELSANAIFSIRAMNRELGYAATEAFRTETAAKLAQKQQLTAQDPGLYRAEATTHYRTNDNLGADIYGITGSTSTLHASSLAFLHAIGYPADSHWSAYQSPNAFSDALLGIKYCFTDNAVPLGYREISSDLYENEAALSLCYRVITEDLAFGHNAANNLNMLAKALSGADLGEVYVPIDSEEYYTVGGTLYDAEQNSLVFRRDPDEEIAAMVFTVTAKTNGDVWFLLPSSTPAELLFTYGEKIDVAKRATGYFVYLGYFSAGETVRMQITLPEKANAFTYYRDQAHFYTMDTAAANAYLSLLAQTQVSFTSVSDHKLIGQVKTSDAQTKLLLTLPFDPCLRVYVDGVRVTTSKAFKGLTAFEVSDAGAHHIEIRYVPTTFFVGAGVSALSLIVALFLLLYRKRRRVCFNSSAESST